jgi:CubicO group peptidase (beta-lactamase class C family)
MPSVPDEKICFWGGWGGSMVLINPDRRTTIAYVMNKDDRLRHEQDGS